MDSINSVTIPGESPVQLRRRIARLPGVRDAVGGGLDMEIFRASQGKPFGDMDEGEIFRYLSEVLDTIVFGHVGYTCRGMNDKTEIATRLSGVLKKYFPVLGGYDFVLAFEMCGAGKLDEYLPRDAQGNPDRKCYGSFSTDYVSRVLNAYKDRRARVLKRAYDAMPKNERTLSPETEKKYQALVIDDCIRAYEHYRDCGELPDLSPIGQMLIYNALAEHGLAREIIITEQEQEEVLRKTLRGLVRSERIYDAEQLRDKGTGAKELEHGSKVLARRRALVETFDKLSSEGVDLKERLKKD